MWGMAPSMCATPFCTSVSLTLNMSILPSSRFRTSVDQTFQLVARRAGGSRPPPQGCLYPPHPPSAIRHDDAVTRAPLEAPPRRRLAVLHQAPTPCAVRHVRPVDRSIIEQARVFRMLETIQRVAMVERAIAALGSTVLN